MRDGTNSRFELPRSPITWRNLVLQPYVFGGWSYVAPTGHYAGPDIRLTEYTPPPTRAINYQAQFRSCLGTFFGYGFTPQAALEAGFAFMLRRMTDKMFDALEVAAWTATVKEKGDHLVACSTQPSGWVREPGTSERPEARCTERG